MSTTALLTWTLVAALGVMTPGIDTMLVLRHTMLGGRRAGFATVVGIATGCLVWATASLAGLTALLAASTLAYDVVRVLLVAIHLAVTFVWFPPVIWAAARARTFLLRAAVRRWLDRATATVLIALGVKLVTDSR